MTHFYELKAWLRFKITQHDSEIAVLEKEKKENPHQDPSLIPIRKARKDELQSVVDKLERDAGL